MSPHEFSNPFETEPHSVPNDTNDSRVRRRATIPTPSVDTQKRFLAEHGRLRFGRSEPVSQDVADHFEDEPELPPLGVFLQPFIGKIPEDVLRQADVLHTPAQQARFLKDWAEGPGAESPERRAARKSREFAQLGEVMYRTYGDAIPTTQYKKRDLTNPADRADEVAKIRETIARRDAPASPPPVPVEVAAASRARYRNRLIQKALDELRASDEAADKRKGRAV